MTKHVLPRLNGQIVGVRIIVESAYDNRCNDQILSTSSLCTPPPKMHHLFIFGSDINSKITVGTFDRHFSYGDGSIAACVFIIYNISLQPEHTVPSTQSFGVRC